MKSEIVVGNNKIITPKIDWNKPNLLMAKSGIVVMSDGEHDDLDFCATILISNNPLLSVGRCDVNWAKNEFTLVTEPLTITFTND